MSNHTLGPCSQRGWLDTAQAYISVPNSLTLETGLDSWKVRRLRLEFEFLSFLNDRISYSIDNFACKSPQIIVFSRLVSKHSGCFHVKIEGIIYIFGQSIQKRSFIADRILGKHCWWKQNQQGKNSALV